MTRGHVSVLGLGIVGLVLAQTAPPAPAQKVGKVAAGWLNNYPAAKAAARQSGKPIFLVFR
jgi:hypothetical protein